MSSGRKSPEQVYLDPKLALNQFDQEKKLKNKLSEVKNVRKTVMVIYIFWLWLIFTIEKLVEAEY